MEFCNTSVINQNQIKVHNIINRFNLIPKSFQKVSNEILPNYFTNMVIYKPYESKCFDDFIMGRKYDDYIGFYSTQMLLIVFYKGVQRINVIIPKNGCILISGEYKRDCKIFIPCNPEKAILLTFLRHKKYNVDCNDDIPIPSDLNFEMKTDDGVLWYPYNIDH